MSLATLKRKTNNGNPRNAPISGKGHLGFALNWKLRVPSMGKTTNLRRRQAKTPFRGTEPMGHGVWASSGGPYAKTLNGRGAISQSQYLQGAFMKYKNNLPTTLSKNHFPMNVIRNGCDVNAITIEQAITKGLMPKNEDKLICKQKNIKDSGVFLQHHRYTLTGDDKKYDKK